MAGLFAAAFVARSLQTHEGYARRLRLGSAKNSWPRSYRNLFVTGPAQITQIETDENKKGVHFSCGAGASELVLVRWTAVAQNARP